MDNIFKKDNRIENSFRIKTIKTMDIIPKEKFYQLQQDVIKPYSLFTVMNDCFDDIMFMKSKEQSIMVQHNTIDRIIGSVKGGRFIFSGSIFFLMKDYRSL